MSVDEMFNSMNPYQSLEVLRADTPEDLVLLIRSIKQPIKIHSIVASGNRHFAYVSGDINIKRVNKKQLNKTE